MPITFIKPGTTIEFMNRRTIFMGLSALLILAGLIGLVTRGLNLGVDFKGGTKLVIAFKGGEHIDREEIRKVVVARFKELQAGGGDPQVEVQDFYSGGDEEQVQRYVLYTELVTLLSEQQKETIAAAVKGRFGEETMVNPPAEGGDQFFITFATEAPIAQRLGELDTLFKEQGLERVVVDSDKVRDLSLEFFKEANLEQGEGESAEKMLAQIEAEEQFNVRVEEFKKVNTDLSFTVRIEELNAKMEEAIRQVPALGERFLAVESSTSVSPSVGSDLLNNGLLAMVYACLGILLYIALRFDFKYGPGAVIALIHDAFITIGIFALTQVPFSLPIVAAILTIIGYSVNDTIIVFDRIRENVEKLKGMAFDRIINTAINETLSRTILTSGTTLLVVFSVLLLGGGLIRDFAFALAVGIIVGTYSSIFIASPFLLWLHGLGAEKSKA